MNPAGQPNVFQWSVYDTGAMALNMGSSAIGTVSDIGPGLVLDSDQAITIAIANGARDYVRRHPEANARMTAQRLANVVVWQVRFFVPGGQICELGPITLDATTGALLARDLSCTA